MGHTSESLSTRFAARVTNWAPHQRQTLSTGRQMLHKAEPSSVNGKTASSSATMEDRTPAESFSKEFYLEFLREVNHKLSQPATSLRFCLEFALQENGEKLKHSVQHALSL